LQTRNLSKGRYFFILLIETLVLKIEGMKRGFKKDIKILVTGVLQVILVPFCG